MSDAILSVSNAQYPSFRRAQTPFSGERNSSVCRPAQPLTTTTGGKASTSAKEDRGGFCLSVDADALLWEDKRDLRSLTLFGSTTPRPTMRKHSISLPNSKESPDDPRISLEWEWDRVRNGDIPKFIISVTVRQHVRDNESGRGRRMCTGRSRSQSSP